MKRYAQRIIDAQRVNRIYVTLYVLYQRPTAKEIFRTRSELETVATSVWHGSGTARLFPLKSCFYTSHYLTVDTANKLSVHYLSTISER